MLTGYTRECNVASPDFILCGCSGFIQKHCRIVNFSRAFIVDCLMVSLKIIIVNHIFRWLLASFEISIPARYASSYLKLRNQRSIMILSAQRAFAIHALPILLSRIKSMYLSLVNWLIRSELMINGLAYFKCFVGMH